MLLQPGMQRRSASGRRLTRRWNLAAGLDVQVARVEGVTNLLINKLRNGLSRSESLRAGVNDQRYAAFGRASAKMTRSTNAAFKAARAKGSISESTGWRSSD